MKRKIAIIIVAILCMQILLTRKSYSYFRLTESEAGCLMVMIGVIYLEPFIPDLRFEQPFDNNSNMNVVLSWPIHFISLDVSDNIITSFFYEPAYTPANKRFTHLFGTRFAHEIFDESLLIYEIGGLPGEEYGFTAGLGLGWKPDDRHNFGVILRVTKTNEETRGDISFDYWPNKYFEF
jgi:hypothetical protein